MQMRPEFIVRRGRFDELEAIRDTHEDSIQSLGTEFYSAEVMNEWGRNRPIEPYIEAYHNGDINFVAKDSEDDRVLGYSAYSLKDGKHWLSRLFVRGAEKGRGIGSALLREVENVTRESFGRELWVTGTLSARAFYDAKGFEFVEDTISPVGRRDDLFMACIVMKKRL